MSETPGISQDPEVIAEEKKLRIWQIRLERYQVLAKAIAVFIQTFRAEAVSLMSGIGTLVLGWFQIRKWVLTGKKEVKQLRADLPRAESPAHTSARTHRATRPSAPVATNTSEVSVPSDSSLPMPALVTDPNTYVWIGLVVAFVWSSIVTWAKKRSKPSTESGGV